MAAGRCSNIKATCLGEPGLPSLESGEPEKRFHELPSVPGRSRSELEGTFRRMQPNVLISQMEKVRPRKDRQLKGTAERRAWPQGSYATWVGIWVTFTKSARKRIEFWEVERFLSPTPNLINCATVQLQSLSSWIF